VEGLSRETEQPPAACVHGPARATGESAERCVTLAVAGGLAASLLLPLFAAGYLVRSPLALLWPCLLGTGCAYFFRKSLASLRLSRPAFALFVSLFVLATLAVLALDSLPPIARDELVYNLALPRLYAQAGSVIDVPFSRYSNYPQLLNLLYVPLVQRGWASGAKLLHALFGLGAAALLLLELRRRVSATVAAATFLVLWTTPVVLVLSASAYVDLGLLFFAVAAWVSLGRYAEEGGTGRLVVGALAAGLAAAVKYNGALVVAAGAVFVLRPGQRAGDQIRSLALYVMLALVPVAPWLVKNAIETGNPLYPFLYSLFGGREVLPTPVGSPLEWRRALYGETGLALWTVPVRAFVAGRFGDPARFDGVFNPLFLAGMLWALRPRASWWERRQLVAALAILYAVLLLDRFFVRFAIAALVPLALLSAMALQRLTARWPRLAGVVVAGALAFSASHFVTYWGRIAPLPYLAGEEGREQLITRFVPEYPVTAWANASLPPRARVYLAFLGSRGYYWRNPYLYDDNFLAPTLTGALAQCEDPACVDSRLRKQGIDCIAAREDLLRRNLADNLPPEKLDLWRDFADSRLVPLRREAGVGLACLRGDAVP